MVANLPNLITLSRLLISPIFFVIYTYYDRMGISFQHLPYYLLFLLILLESSDWLDGFIARKYNQITDLGKLLDPMSDNISRTCIFLTFTTGFIQIPMLWIFIILYRESFVHTLRSLCALKGMALAARTSGKIKAVIFGTSFIAITLLMIPYSHGIISYQTLRNFSTYLVVFASLYSIYSAIDYFYANRSYLNKIFKQHYPHS